MSQAVLLGLFVAAVNTGVSQWANSSGGTNADFWRAQGLKFLFRFCAIFGGAAWIWMEQHQLPQVVAFILTGAIVQMGGQIYFFIKRTVHARNGEGY